MKNNLYLDINILQTVPAANINRDDTGAAKTVVYGGKLRSRVSSQSWKRAVRMAFKDNTTDADWMAGLRTKKLVQKLAHELQKLNADLSADDAIKQAVAACKKVGLKPGSKKDDYALGALAMISNAQLRNLAALVAENPDFDGKAAKQAFKENNSLDLALFGRMVADDTSLNVDAACQVAHAVSTHEITPEFDYFTAVDDVKDDASQDSGAAMLGSVEYNSSTLYRYANINVNELMHNLGEKKATVKGIVEFVKDFALTMPTGKQNSYANKTLPQYIMLTLRDDTPVNLVSAFEEPVSAGEDGYVIDSIAHLEDEYDVTQKMVDAPLKTWVLTTKKSKINEDVANMSELLQQLSDELSKWVKADEDAND